MHKAKFVTLSQPENLASTFQTKQPNLPPLILLSTSGIFQGVEHTHASFTTAALREDNAQKNKSMMHENNTKFTSKQLLNFIDASIASGRNEPASMGFMLERDCNHSYPMINDDYRNKIQEKLGTTN